MSAEASAWPPAPHDPRERERATAIGDWEVRLFTGRKFQYFVTRGFWHLQLWNPTSRISILSPSRLTCGRYEAFPVASWKVHARSYEALVARIREEHQVACPDAAAVMRVERAFVRDLVRAQSLPVS